MESTHGRESSLHQASTPPGDKGDIIEQVQFRTTNMAHGGSAVARIDGKAFFVDGLLPGELATGTIEVDKGSWGKIALKDVLEASPNRVDPACRYFDRCGGCQWQHGRYEAQLTWKRDIVAGQLEHLGRHPDPPVRDTVSVGPSFGYRNRMDYRVASGRPALYARRSRQLVPLGSCEILHPNLAAVFEDLGDLSGVEELTLRTSTSTGEVLLIIKGNAPPQASSWGCNVAVVAEDGVHPVHGRASLDETVAGVPFRITGRSFFQNNTAGAEALVSLVAEAAGLRADDTMLDAYAGGGLFAAAVGRSAGRVLAIELDQTSAEDLQANLNRAEIDSYRVIRAATEDAIEHIGEYWDVAIADPPRKGLGAEGADAVTAAEPRTLVYVSCDPASLARDTQILAEYGYDLDWVVPVDMFPQTFHIECVARFERID